MRSSKSSPPKSSPPRSSSPRSSSPISLSPNLNFKKLNDKQFSKFQKEMSKLLTYMVEDPDYYSNIEYYRERLLSPQELTNYNYIKICENNVNMIIKEMGKFHKKNNDTESAIKMQATIIFGILSAGEVLRKAGLIYLDYLKIPNAKLIPLTLGMLLSSKFISSLSLIFIDNIIGKYLYINFVELFNNKRYYNEYIRVVVMFSDYYKCVKNI